MNGGVSIWRIFCIYQRSTAMHFTQTVIVIIATIVISPPPPSLSHTLFLRLSATIKWTTQSFQEIHRERVKLLHRQFFLSISNFYLKTFDLFRIFACTTFPSFSIIERRYLRNLSVQSTSAYVLVGLSFSRFLRHRYQLHDNMYAVEQLAMRSAAHTPAQKKNSDTHTH